MYIDQKLTRKYLYIINGKVIDTTFMSESEDGFNLKIGQKQSHGQGYVIRVIFN